MDLQSCRCGKNDICDGDEIAMIPVPAHQIGPGELLKWNESVIGCISDLVLLHCCLVYLNRMNGITVPDQSLTAGLYICIQTVGCIRPYLHTSHFS